MALSSRNWLFKHCYLNVRRQTRLEPLAHRALTLGFGADNTSGHILQACGATQQFLARYPAHCRTIRQSAVRPFRLRGEVLDDWLAFFNGKHGSFGRKDFGYDWDKLRRLLPPAYGGTRQRGGGGKNEFEIVLRLVAAFL